MAQPNGRAATPTKVLKKQNIAQSGSLTRALYQQVGLGTWLHPDQHFCLYLLFKRPLLYFRSVSVRFQQSIKIMPLSTLVHFEWGEVGNSFYEQRISRFLVLSLWWSDDLPEIVSTKLDWARGGILTNIVVCIWSLRDFKISSLSRFLSDDLMTSQPGAT